MSSPRKPGVRGPLQGAFTLYIFVALLVGYTIPAHATETDYLPDNTTWNGTSALADLAAGQQLPVTLVNHLHWGDIDTRDVLFIIYPRISLHETQFLAFLRAGGHVLIADDFGSAAPLLTKLGIKRKPYTSPSTQRAAASSPRETQAFFAKNPALPIAIPARQAHPFLVGVRRVVTNHPSTFTSLLPSLLAINGEQKVLIAGRLGKGRFVALSDPSVLINSMLRFADNKLLATNLLVELGRGHRRILLLTGNFTQKGEAPVDTSKQRSAARRVNLAINHVNNFVLTGAGMRVLAFVLAGLFFGIALLWVPRPRRDLDGRWFHPGTRLLRLDGTANAAFQLREEVENRLAAVLEVSDPISSLPPLWVSDRLRERTNAEAADLCRKLLKALRHIPYTPDPYTPDPYTPDRGSFGETRPRELEALYNMTRRLFDHIGEGSLPNLERSPDKNV